MNNQPTASISEHFASLEDPRIERTKLHQLLDILVIAICAIICGADDWVEVELFGNAKLTWLRTFLELPNGIPSHDTFGRVFERLNPEQFQQCFLAWIQAVSEVTYGQVIAIDGKVLRGSCDRVLGKAGIAMLSAWATANHLVLGRSRSLTSQTRLRRSLMRVQTASSAIDVTLRGLARQLPRRRASSEESPCLSGRDSSLFWPCCGALGREPLTLCVTPKSRSDLALKLLQARAIAGCIVTLDAPGLPN